MNYEMDWWLNHINISKFDVGRSVLCAGGASAFGGDIDKNKICSAQTNDHS